MSVHESRGHLSHRDRDPEQMMVQLEPPAWGGRPNIGGGKGSCRPLVRVCNLLTRAFRSYALALVFGFSISAIGRAYADPCSDPDVQAQLRQRADTEINRIFNASRSGERPRLLPQNTYALSITAQEEPQAGSYRKCTGVIAIAAQGGQQAAVKFNFDLSDAKPRWGYAPFHIANLVTRLSNATKVSADQKAEQQASQVYDETRAKGAPICPSWLDEGNNRERADRAAYWIAKSLERPREPGEALKMAQSDLASTAILRDQNRRLEAKRMTEADFVACVPAIGKVLLENDHRYVDDKRERELAAEPPGQLLDAYKNYIAVKQCAESRAAYEVKYIQDSELEEAKALSKVVEDKLTALRADIDKEKIWDDAQANPATRAYHFDRTIGAILRLQAMAAVKGNQYNEAGQSYCRSSLDALRGERDVLAPEARKIRKDF